MLARLGRLLGRVRPRRARPATSPRRWHSVSSTREYEGCPRRYHYGYVQKRPPDRPAPPTWRFGSVVHAGLEAAYLVAVERPDAPRSLRAAAAIEAIDASWRRYELPADDRAGRDRAVWLTTRALATDVVEVDRGRILGVELAFRGRLSDRDRIAGFADLVLARPDGTIQIVDHKVTRSHRAPRQLHEDFQLNLYGELARQRWPGTPRIVASHHYPTGPALVSTELGNQGMLRALARVRTAAARIDGDRSFAPTPSPRCEHCPWLPSCPEGRAWTGTTAG